MKILVCVKQVPESEAPVSIDETAGWVQIGGAAENRMNRFDECAVEEAVLIKEADPGTVIDIITVGPENADAVVRRALGMGADNGIHMVTAEEGYRDAFRTAGAIVSWAEKEHYDLVLTGVMSEDLMQGQVGPLIAAHLEIPCVTAVVFEKLSPGGKSIRVEREIEGGCRETGEIKLPALLTLQTGINKPRYPALSKLLRANRTALAVADADPPEMQPSFQKLVRVALPEKKRDALFLEGSAGEKAEKLLVILKERSLI